MTRRLAVYGTPAYRQLWRVVDGAVRNTIAAHGDYFTPKGLKSARASFTKRATGAVLGYAQQSLPASAAALSGRARSSSSEAREMGDGACTSSLGPAIPLPRWPFVGANHETGEPRSSGARL